MNVNLIHKISIFYKNNDKKQADINIYYGKKIKTIYSMKKTSARNIGFVLRKQKSGNTPDRCETCFVKSIKKFFPEICSIHFCYINSDENKVSVSIHYDNGKEKNIQLMKIENVESGVWLVREKINTAPKQCRGCIAGLFKRLFNIA